VSITSLKRVLRKDIRLVDANCVDSSLQAAKNMKKDVNLAIWNVQENSFKDKLDDILVKTNINTEPIYGKRLKGSKEKKLVL
jgi:hypothetical protein